jgi:hypothetical protein
VVGSHDGLQAEEREIHIRLDTSAIAAAAAAASAAQACSVVNVFSLAPSFEFVSSRAPV